MSAGQLQQIGDRGYGLRLLLTLVAGALGALLLTWFMFQLIHSSHHRLDESARVHMLDFVRVKRDESSARKQLKPSRPVQPDAPPQPSNPKSDDNSTDASLAISALPDGSGGDLDIGGLGFGGADGEFLPIVKVAPIYPPRALSNRIEGNCTVVYTVTINGSTRDVKVVEDMCTHKAFYRASVEAAEKFKYKPRVIDGEPVEVHDVHNRFIYEIDRDE